MWTPKQLIPIMRRKLLWLTVRGPFKRPSARRIVFSITLAMPCSFISLKIGIHRTNKDINTLIFVHVHMILGFCLELSSLSWAIKRQRISAIFLSTRTVMRPFLLNSASSLLVYHVALTSSLVLGSVSMRVENVENLTRFLLPVGSNMNRFIFVFVIGCITLQLFVRSNATIIGNG